MFPGVTAPPVVGQGGLSTLLELSGPARGALCFVFVLLVGVGLLTWRAPTVDRAVDLTVDGTPLAVIYGVVAFGLLTFVGGYVFTQLARVAPSAAVLQAALAGVGLGAVALGGFGYLVLGTWITEIEGTRRPWPGAVVGAGISAVPWLFLSTWPATGAWLLLAAFGLGSVTRNWVHGERTVESETSG